MFNMSKLPNVPFSASQFVILRSILYNNNNNHNQLELRDSVNVNVSQNDPNRKNDNFR